MVRLLIKLLISSSLAFLVSGCGQISTGIAALVSGKSQIQMSAPNDIVNNYGMAKVQVSLNQAPSSTISVHYTTSDGTAVAGTDYVTTSGTLTIASGQTTASVYVPLLWNSDSGSKNFSLSLTDLSGTILGTTTSTINMAPVTHSHATSFTQIAGYGTNFCGVTSTGSVFCWGQGVGYAGVDITGLAAPATQVGVSYSHFCALLNTGAVQCWGTNADGELGDNQASGRYSATPVNVANLGGTVTQISVGYFDTCALLSDGTVKCWGMNGYGQLGNGNQTQQNEAVSVSGLGGTVIQVAAGTYHTCALLSGGTIQCWGDNMFGELGNGTESFTPSTSPVNVSSLTGVTQITAGWDTSCALLSAGTVQCWGNNTNGDLGSGGASVPMSVGTFAKSVTQISLNHMYNLCATLSDGTVQCLGNNQYGQLGNGTTTGVAVNNSTPVSVTGLSDSATQVAVADGTVCALMGSPGGVQCWGSTSWALGDPTVITAYAMNARDPQGLSSGVTGVVTGNSSCAIVSGAVRCWGSNAYGQLGINNTTNQSTPVSVTALSGTATQLSEGLSNTCALRSDGTVQCWGDNYYGQLGNGNTTEQNQPVSVTGLSGTVTQIASGDYHTCAIISDGSVQCWGVNATGQLGSGNTTNESSPITVTGLSGTTVTQLAAGTAHTCALLSTGAVKCWGDNSKGELGDNGASGAKSTSPVSVSGLSGSTVTQIVAADYHTCALLSTGAMECWGNNTSGELGTGNTTPSSVPVSVAGLNASVTQIATGSHHTCALLSTGGIYCWGNNTYGELGSSDLTDSLSPVAVSQMSSGVLSIVAHESNTCATVTDDGLKCWGSNSYGQIGQSFTTFSGPVWVW